MWAPMTHPRNGDIWVGTLNGVGGQGQERSCWKVLLPSSGGSQEVLESRMVHGPSTVGVPTDAVPGTRNVLHGVHLGARGAPAQRVRSGKGTALVQLAPCCGPTGECHQQLPGEWRAVGC